MQVRRKVCDTERDFGVVAKMKKGRMGSRPKSVDAYLSAVPPDARASLQELRRTILEAAPMAEESISYQMPVFKHKGPLVYFAAFKDHNSLFVASKAIVREFSTELKGFHNSGATIHFTPENPLPASLVKRLVKAKIRENEARAKAKIKRYS